MPNPKDLPDGRRVYTYTCKPLPGGLEETLDAIERQGFDELFSDAEPGWRLHHASISADYRTGEDGIRRRRGNRFSVRVYLEEDPSYRPDQEFWDVE